MHICVVVFVIVSQRFDDGAGLLGCGGVIEINQRMPVDLLVEDREILPEALPISLSSGNLMHCSMWGRPRPASLSSLERSVLIGINEETEPDPHRQRGVDQVLISIHSFRARESATAWTTRM